MPDPDTALTSLERAITIHEVVKLLSHKQQRLIDLRYFKKLPLAVVACEMRIRRSEAQRLHTSALTALRNLINLNPGWEDLKDV